MDETVNQGTTTQENDEGTQEAQKTFTQEEMNKIIADRVQRERSKYNDYDALKEKAAKYDAHEEASKTELQKATEKAEKLEAELKGLKKAEEIKGIREKVAEKTGVPASLLNADTEEACTVQAKAILAFAQSNGYPEVRDGGEVRTTSRRTTADQFAEWMKKQTK